MVSTPRAYCFLTKWPLFELHFEWIAKIMHEAAQLQFKALESPNQCGPSWSTVPMGDQIRAMERALERCARCTSQSDTHNLIRWCADAPEEAAVRNIVKWGCTRLFVLVDQVRLRLLLSSILLEEQVIVLSTTPSVVSPCCLALSTLILPLRVAGVHLPVLPLPALVDVIEAPIPYLIGLVKSNNPPSFPQDVVRAVSWGCVMAMILGCSGSGSARHFLHEQQTARRV